MKKILRKILSASTRNKIRGLFGMVKWPRDALFCAVKGLRWDPTWQFYGLPIVTQYHKQQIQIGKNFIACSKPGHNSIGVSQPVIIRAMTPEAVVDIGNNCGISGASISCRESVTIGDNCLIGSGVLITDNDAHPLKDREKGYTVIHSAPILIEDNVFIGARSIILKGVRIGKDSVIGAGSVVTKDIRPACIAAGNPAKELKQL
jgi:acetyltransferase-like isoleucine patch superfamily enzyme